MTITAKGLWGSPTSDTITLASLASDTNLLAGRAGTYVDHTVNGEVDSLLFGKIMTGTSPTASRQIEVWVAGSGDATLFGDGISGTDGNVTLLDKNQLRLACIIPTTGTSNQSYVFGPISIASLFGFLPPQTAIFIVHNTAVVLHATGSNHAIKRVAVNFQSS